MEPASAVLPRIGVLVPALAWLLVAGIAGCSARRADESAGGRPTATDGSAAPADAGGARGAGDAGPSIEVAGTVRSRTELFEMFLEAARTDLERPYATGLPASDAFYSQAGGVLLDRDPPTYRSASIVAEVLAQSNDPRVEAAMIDWAAAPTARRHIHVILWGMSARPRAAYLEPLRTLLADEELGAVIERWTREGRFAEALGIRTVRSVHAHALRVAAALPGPQGRELVRRIAVDRAASAPDPKVLAALQCPAGEVRIEIEARGLASRRIMALDALDDRELMAKIRDDPSEPELVRYWTRRMLAGGPDRSKPDWETRLDARQRHAHERSQLEFAGADTSPCFLAHPKSQMPKLAPGVVEPQASSPPVPRR
jgi:hypothetical protein